MEKPIPTNIALHDILRRRWSRRSFSEQPVEREKLERVLEAARWSPSAFNAQPARFLVATKDNSEEYDKLLSVLLEGNIVWAQHAPVLLLAVARLTSERDNQPNIWAQYDTGQAAAHLTFQAGAEGLAVHQMAGFLPDKARELYGIPEDYQPIAAIAVGYPGDPADLPENIRARDEAPRVRKPLSELVFAGHWGEAAPITTDQ